MSSSGPSKAVSSEDIIAQKTDLCVSNAIVKTGIGFGAGVVLSVLLFKRRSFPVWLGTGFGLGSGYTDCERSFNPLSVPGVRIVSSTSPSAPPAAKTTLERLQQRTGEVFGQARANVEPRAESIKDQAVSKAQELKEQAIDKGNEALGKAKSEAKKIENKFPIHSPIEQRDLGQDCLVCRVTGVATMGGLGGYALLEAYRLGAFTRNDGISSKSLQKLTNGKPATSRAHATLLALFGAACCVGAVMRAVV